MEGLLNFIKYSKTQYHAVKKIKEILDDLNYTELKEESIYNIKPLSNYYIIRNNSSIMAFKTPKDINNTSLKIVASHTDSPTFKVKPNNQLIQDVYSSLNTEVYGGPIYSSFFDKPLSLAGRVFIEDGNYIKEELLDFDYDMLVIPNECIHFNRDINTGKKYNEQIDLLPLLGNKDLNLDDLISKELNIDKSNILSYDLQIYNRFRGNIIGPSKEYFMAPQIDNLESAYLTLQGFIKSNNQDDLNIYISFDNEEVGSKTKQGAASDFMLRNIERIFNALNSNSDSLSRAISSGILVSCDNAHAVHPNDIAKTDKLNKVYMNEGIVIKHNANQSYTTDGLSSAVLKSIFNKHNIKYQDFTNKSDVRGGSTLGAISLSQLTIPSVDIGLAQLAMHSSCETAGCKDAQILINGIEVFYNAKIRKTSSGYEIN